VKRATPYSLRHLRATDQPERAMVSIALLPGILAAAAAFAVGALLASPAVGLSAALGIAAILVNFALAGLSLAWAARISVAAVAAVALGGWLLRMGLFGATMYLLGLFPWFSAAAFGLTAVPALLVLLITEAMLVLEGMGERLILPGTGAGGGTRGAVR
jgi:hypothetical protein